jgi:hypothetical protein
MVFEIWWFPLSSGYWVLGWKPHFDLTFIDWTWQCRCLHIVTLLWAFHGLFKPARSPWSKPWFGLYWLDTVTAPTLACPSFLNVFLLEDFSRNPCVVSCDGWRCWLLLRAFITSAWHMDPFNPIFLFNNVAICIPSVLIYSWYWVGVEAKCIWYHLDTNIFYISLYWKKKWHVWLYRALRFVLLRQTTTHVFCWWNNLKTIKTYIFDIRNLKWHHSLKVWLRHGKEGKLLLGKAKTKYFYSTAAEGFNKLYGIG